MSNWKGSNYMAVEKEQIREFLDIESSELKNFIDSIDAEALIAARELILQAEQNHNRVHDRNR